MLEKFQTNKNRLFDHFMCFFFFHFSFQFAGRTCKHISFIVFKKSKRVANNMSVIKLNVCTKVSSAAAVETSSTTAAAILVVVAVNACILYYLYRDVACQMPWRLRMLHANTWISRNKIIILTLALIRQCLLFHVERTRLRYTFLH